MNFALLKTKEIVRVSDGKKLGFAEDLIIDEDVSKINYFKFKFKLTNNAKN